MEILAPAGNMTQALAAIDAGCDAIYGGFKQWSARNRADNFTVEEYHSLLKICHERNVKFYLTLNILFKNEEIDAVVNLFQDPSFCLPDAVIVTDIGLIITLRKYFSKLVIHASTQFGVSTIDDLHILEKLGVKRAILSRELSMSEISILCKNTYLEIEVFVYGSQCLAFSGQCLWGGILHGCSGNRGRCIGMCRDIYYSESNPHRIGQFFYPRDIDAVLCLNELERIGVCSAKIEGRMRPTEEITQVVASIKANIDIGNGYVGYLGNSLPVKNMFAEVNGRTKSRSINDVKLSCHDLCISKREKHLSYCNGNENTHYEEQEFVKCVYSNPLQHNQTNISLRLITSGTCVQKIDFINTNGERKVFELSITSNISSKHTIDWIYKFIIGNINNNIYEFTSNSSSLESVHINLEELQKILNEINQNYYRKFYDIVYENQFSITYDDFIETQYAQAIVDFKEKGFKKFIYNVTGITELKKVLKLFRNDNHIIYKIPSVDFNDQVNRIFSLLKNKRIMISKMSQVLYLNELCYSEVIGNYTLNIFNKATAQFLKCKGISSVVCNPELSFQRNMEIINEFFDQSLIITFGKFPIASTRACFSEIKFCTHNCKESFNTVNSSKGYSLKVCCDNELGVRNIFLNNTIGSNIKVNTNNLNRIVLADYLDNDVKKAIQNLEPTKYEIELYRRSVN